MHTHKPTDRHCLVVLYHYPPASLSLPHSAVMQQAMRPERRLWQQQQQQRHKTATFLCCSSGRGFRLLHWPYSLALSLALSVHISRESNTGARSSTRTEGAHVCLGSVCSVWLSQQLRCRLHVSRRLTLRTNRTSSAPPSSSVHFDLLPPVTTCVLSSLFPSLHSYLLLCISPDVCIESSVH